MTETLSQISQEIQQFCALCDLLSENADGEPICTRPEATKIAQLVAAFESKVCYYAVAAGEAGIITPQGFSPKETQAPEGQ